MCAKQITTAIQHISQGICTVHMKQPRIIFYPNYPVLRSEVTSPIWCFVTLTRARDSGRSSRHSAGARFGETMDPQRLLLSK